VKILHVAASYLPARRYGGTIISAHGLCRALAARGHDVHVFTTSVNGAQDSDVPLGVPVEMEGVKVWYFRSTFLRRLYWAPALARELKTRIGTFDIVHLHAIYLWPMWAAASLARRAGVPYVISLRGMLEKGLIRSKSRVMKLVALRLRDRHNLEHAAAIHVTSRREAEEAAAFGFRLPRWLDIPNGANFEAATGEVSAEIAALIEGGPYILFLGRVNWKKGLDRLLAALPHAPAVRLIVAGNDEEHYRDQLDRQAAALGIEARVSWPGYVQGADKAALLLRAVALVLPSYSENFGNVVVEAMAAGCPVIVTPEVGLAEVVTGTGAGLVVDGAPESLGVALERLSNSPGLRRQLGDCGRRAAAESFTWEAVAAAMEAAYASLLKPGRGPS
jgi:glycosyltransferase involved in cell wall biosynthesis